MSFLNKKHLLLFPLRRTGTKTNLPQIPKSTDAQALNSALNSEMCHLLVIPKAINAM